MSTPNNTDYLCSFCSKAQNQVRRLIAGRDRVFICDECVILCDQIISEENEETLSPIENPLKDGVTPKYIYARLEEYVIGQDFAKKSLSVAVYNHYKKIWSNSQNLESDIELQKSNILMYGPSGSGKTYLAQTLAKILNVPFAIADATSLTEAGYVGEDVENILLSLIQAADYDIPRAEQGIIYIDEIDKVSRKNPNPSITRDVSGEGVQQAMLKIIEGCVANVPPQGGRKHPHQDFMQIKTDNILFIVGGAFEGMDEIINKRTTNNINTFGFNKLSNDEPDKPDEKDVTSDDLMQYGFIREFVGRLPVLVTLNDLTREELIQIMTKPKNAFVKQYQALFEMDNITLEFTDQSLEAAADKAIQQQTGARGLRSIIESTLLDVMYELPSIGEAKNCTVSDEAVRGEEPVKITKESGELIRLPIVKKRSA